MFDSEKGRQVLCLFSPFNLDQSQDLLVQDIKDKVCSRRIKNLLADLIAECDFTQADLEDLEAVVSEKKSSAVTKVKCNCM